ncbi:hypothetical protein T10_2832 [Trichinella papuae]|uniref:Uncharacterized protein n=1 Tax=Trichinella papuae TaxID=268474 RepID=A0A0V1M9S5_9BILA|nr:hypothetical protein T10_2832 [Trichinella papuae]
MNTLSFKDILRESGINSNSAVFPASLAKMSDMLNLLLVGELIFVELSFVGLSSEILQIFGDSIEMSDEKRISLYRMIE